jgi:hypothetical protein
MHDPDSEQRNTEVAPYKQGPSIFFRPKHYINRIIWAVGGVGLVAINDLITKIAPVWHLSSRQQMELMLLGIAVLCALGIGVSRMLRPFTSPTQ